MRRTDEEGARGCTVSQGDGATDDSAKERTRPMNIRAGREGGVDDPGASGRTAG